MLRFKALLLLLLCFSSIYSIKVVFFPVTLALALWLPFAMIAFYRRPLRFSYCPGTGLPFLAVFGLLTYSFVTSAVVGKGADFSIPYNYLVWLLVFIPAALVLSAETTRQQSGSVADAYSILVAVIGLQSIFIYASFISPAFRDFSSSLLVQGDQAMGDLTTRVKGLSSGGGAVLSLIQGVGAVVSLKLFVRDVVPASPTATSSEDPARRYDPKYVIAAVLIAGSTLFAGRTGVIFISLFLLMYIPYCLLTGKLRTGTLVLWLSVSALLVLGAYNQLLSEELRGLIEDVVLVRSFDLFTSVFSGDSVADHGAVTAIQQMYQFPSRLSTWLVGDGLFTSSGMNYAGDPGYIKYLYFFGLTGCLGMYGYFVLLMCLTLRNTPTREERAFVLIFYMLFFLAETKEPFFAKLNFFHHLLYFRSAFLAAARRTATRGAPAPADTAVPVSLDPARWTA